MKKILSISAVAFVGSASIALAGGGCNWGHHEVTTAEADAPVVVEETVVATVNCENLTGDALAACIAAQAQTSN